MGSHADFERLYADHAGQVRGYVLRRCDRSVADDVVADVFLVAWRRLDHVPGTALPWLLGTARRSHQGGLDLPRGHCPEHRQAGAVQRARAFHSDGPDAGDAEDPVVRRGRPIGHKSGRFAYKRAVDAIDRRADAELLRATAREPEASAAFYRRHLEAVVRYFMARTHDPELSADLTAEVFAAALAAAGRYRADRAPALVWLYAIARNKLRDSVRRGQVEDRARRRLGMAPAEMSDDDVAHIEAVAAGADPGEPLDLLAHLPDDMRRALSARVIEERPYGDIARELRCSESVVRKRVSRGLARLRAQLEETA